MKVLGVIPARGGSKRVKDKNIRPLAGLPLIAHTIRSAHESKRLTDVIVSTDSEVIKKVAEEHGGTVPFLRPAALAQDASPDRPMLLHALDFMQVSKSVTYDAVALLRPTSPFRTGAMIDKVIETLVATNGSSIRTMTLAQGVHHPYWMFTANEQGQAFAFDPEHTTEEFYQSSLLPPVLRLNGVVDVITVDALRSRGDLYGERMSVYKLTERESLDIDTEHDFELAEFFARQKD